MEFDNTYENWKKYKDYDSEELGLELFNLIKVLIYNKLDYDDTDYNEYELLNDDDDLSDFYANEIALEDIPALEDLESIFEDFPDLIDSILDLFEVNISTYYEETFGNDDYADDDFDLDSIAVSVLLNDIDDLCYDFATDFLDNLEIII